MRNLILLTSLIFLANSIFCQEKIISGDYGVGLQLAFNNQTNVLTGYYENYTGWDETTNKPSFSCIFYIEGLINADKVKIKTYYPNDKSESTIEGYLEIIDNETISILLPSEHGGCWNVEHFADKPVLFQLNKDYNWTAIRYIKTKKSYFYNRKSNDSRLNSYLIEGNIVLVEKLEENWAFCTYVGKQKTTKAWIKTADLNTL